MKKLTSVPNLNILSQKLANPLPNVALHFLIGIPFEILFSWSLTRGGENWRLQSIHCNIAQLTTWGVNVHARVLSIRFCAVQNGAKDLFVLFWKSSVQKKGSCLVYIDRAKQIKLVSKAKQSYVSLVESKMFRCFGRI